MRRLSLVLLAVAALGCGSDTPTEIIQTLPPSDANVVGAFHLVSANGVVLPILALNSSVQIANLIADTVAITPDNNWVETSVFDVLSLIDGTEGTVKTLSSGTYVFANAQISFTTTVGGTSVFTGAVTGNTLLLLFNNKPFSYSR